MDNLLESLGGELLSYGVSGFALIMIGLTYYLMRSELKREEPRSIAVKTIWGFMTLVLVSTAIVGFFSLPIANENDELSAEVNTLTSDMSQLLAMVTQYEVAINQLVETLEDNNVRGDNNPPTRPNTDIRGVLASNPSVFRYVDYSRIQPVRTYQIQDVNDSISTQVREQAERTLRSRSQIHQIPIQQIP
ncbi:hypothetical protein [Psychroserpens algicola]|uniref:Uncharacterized protein n=1 Tax=Psychroserpens algicola TaxID=1719034 RepID=A0ABT0H3R1_9FLAO|nr:hypothetical protein [Psychroserpens algicola]MCK8479010.1 hypothetical protein [Psychroserpens algicola]